MGWIVEEGLKGGERVATDNLLKLAPGARRRAETGTGRRGRRPAPQG